MRTARTKVYQFIELSKAAQDKAILWFIPLVIEGLQEPKEGDYCPYWEAAMKMEKMQTPWFLGETLFFDYRQSLIEDIIANEYEFTVDGNRF